MNGNKHHEPHTASLGNMKASTLVLLCCLALILFGFWGFVFCCIVVAIERKSGFVKFNVTQAALVWAAFAVLVSVLSIINGTFSFFSYWLTGYRSSSLLGGAISLLNIIRFIVLVVMAVQANKWQGLHIPVLANIAEVISHTGAPVLYDGDGPVPPECQTFTQPPYTHNPHGNTQPGGWQQPQSPQQGGYGAPQPGTGNGQPWQQGQPAQASQPAPQATPQQPQTPPPNSPYADPNQQLPPEMRDSAPPKDMH